ncbi:MAG: tRNA (adenosine(37)-N6)-threonylcarbamoyltransferase complex dimerization subunit type 1 TsaB [Dehalococcoidales bacterium]|nr:tRNA (adenosine(37)-N6)-threonylcarbamoyltransferase complex dimerization subunit type 1 TsaB [Dehalococcoidales bacterium]
MLVLGIDTSGYANAIGVADDGRVLADFVFKTRNESLAKIMLNVDSVLKEASLGLEDIDGFGVGLGPGSWTGIRIGVTVGKIFAYCTGKPVKGMSTLEVLACGARDYHTLICPIVDAGARETIYAAFYRSGNNGIYQVGDYYVGDLPGLAEVVKEPVVLVAADVPKYRNVMGQLLKSNTIEALESAPSGAAVALLAAACLQSGEHDDTLALAPMYLKESTARAFVNKYLKRNQAAQQG